MLRLRDLREDHDLTQTEVAGRLNCSQECYSRYESEARAIPLGALAQLADLYGTSVDYIMRRTNEMKPYPK